MPIWLWRTLLFKEFSTLTLNWSFSGDLGEWEGVLTNCTLGLFRGRIIWRGGFLRNFAIVHKRFYKNWAFCRALIGRELHSIRAQTMEICFLFLARAIFLEASTEMDVKNCKCYCKKKTITISHGLYSYRLEKWRHNVENFAVKPLTRLQLVVPWIHGGYTWVWTFWRHFYGR